MAQRDSDQIVKKDRKFGINWVKSAANIFVALLIFVLGIGVGNGRVAFGSDAIFRKSLQKGLPNNLDYSSVEQVYDLLKLDFDGQLDQTKLLDGLKSGLTQASGDNYTEYFNPEQAKALNDDLNGAFTGIGAKLGKENGAIIIMSPLPGYPAEKVGLRAKDIIAKINDETTQNMTIDEAVKKIRGKVDTEVSLTIIRNDKKLDFKITRQQIIVPSVEYQILDGNIGYLQITQFNTDTTELAQKAANEFKQKNVKGVMLDMRGDPGGYLDAAVDVASLWLPAGKTVLSERRGGVVIKSYEAKGSSTLLGIPTVVLIDGGSASASEIVAGALKDNGVATLIGEKSFGKGSVQNIEKLLDGSALKVTIARWYTPNGQNIDKQGIEPDQKVERSEDDFKNNRDPQKDAAINFLKK
ncbi:S41 family peptidase [Candidatus Saccharibacteria bacterium]|nr:S41 family peptidase [Candidatus Saccharibacteria bacterium]MBI3338424.1 S41 family peptidase [Candidatus Saccharibacteria bacterium]